MGKVTYAIDDSAFPSSNTGPSVWAFGSGKGGVGKSLFAINTGIILAKSGNKVLMIDADLGAANLHTLIGMEGSSLSLSSFLKSETADLKAFIKQTSVAGMDIITGAKDSLDVANLEGRSVGRLIKALPVQGYDYIILDIGPGTSTNGLDLFLCADNAVMLTTPDPTSVENCYRFIKCLLLRRLKNIMKSEKNCVLKTTLSGIFNGKYANDLKTVADILRLLQLSGSGGDELLARLLENSISFVINQTRKESDAEIGPSIKRACFDYFGININYLGAMSYEDSVVESVFTKRPLALHYTNSQAYKSMELCIEGLVDLPGRVKQC